MSQTANTAPVGVFDSGVGGLSVLRSIRDLLPHENLIYVADSAHLPYGEKSRDFVEHRAVAISQFLVSQGVKAIVVACNTATSAAITALRQRFELPIVGVEPALKPAVEKTRCGVVGVLATSGTLHGEKFHQLYERFATRVEVLMQSCPGLVEQVESGELSSARTRALVKRYVAPLLEHGADTLVLGCTHYPFLTPVIQEVAGTSVSVIDPSPAVARELQRRLAEKGLLSEETSGGIVRFWTSASVQTVQGLIRRLWGEQCSIEPLPLASACVDTQDSGIVQSDQSSVSS